MELIDKELIIKELKTRIDLCDKFADAAAEYNLHNALEANELLIREYERIISFLNTLEVKEVDLKDEVRKYVTNTFEALEKEISEYKGVVMQWDDMMVFAKHFYELGLSAKKRESMTTGLGFANCRRADYEQERTSET